MKTERIVLSVIAILIGLFVAGIVFYFFQLAGKKPEKKDNLVSLLPSPTSDMQQSTITINSPEDETVVETKSVKLMGKAPINTAVVIATENGQDVVLTDANGEFSDTVSLDEGVNLIHISAIGPNGKSESVIWTVSYSTETF